MKMRTEPFVVLIPSLDGKDISERVSIEVVHEWDEELEEWLLSPESLQKIDDTKARRMGLLLPEELKELRERLGLSQREIANKLEIGEKTWSRWESGRHRPSRSMNLLVRALNEGRLDTPTRSSVDYQKAEWKFLALNSEQYQMQMILPAQTPACQYDQYASSYTINAESAANEQELLAA